MANRLTLRLDWPHDIWRSAAKPEIDNDAATHAAVQDLVPQTLARMLSNVAALLAHGQCLVGVEVASPCAE